MPDTYRCAVIGVGAPQDSMQRGGGHQIGYTHARMYQSSPAATLAACADIRPENLAAFQREFEIGSGYADYREMLARENPDIVSICTYVGLHEEMLAACVEAGVRAVVCEKPFVNSPAELRRVEALLAGASTKVVVAHIRRYLPVYRRAAELYNSGAVGDPVMCLFGVPDWDLAEMCSHYFDLARMLHGDRPVRWVMGQARVTDSRGYGHAMEDHALGYFEFEGGGKAMIDAGIGLNGPFTFVGTEGTIRCFREAVLEVQNADGKQVEDFSDDPGTGWQAIWGATLANLIGWLEGGPEPGISARQGLLSSELYLAAYLSAWRGDRVDLPLADPMDEWPVEALARRSASPSRLEGQIR